MANLLQLQAELEENRSRAEELRARIRQIELTKALPILREKYEGKYFKFQNSYGRESENWFVYAYCKKVIDINVGVFDKFQSSPDDNTFHFETKAAFYTCEVEITQKEYDTALNEFKSILNAL